MIRDKTDNKSFCVPLLNFTLLLQYTQAQTLCPKIYSLAKLSYPEYNYSSCEVTVTLEVTFTS